MVTKSLTLQVEIKDLVEQNILEIASCIWSFNKGRGDLAFQWRKEGLFNKKELEKLVVYLEKKMNLDPTLTPYPKSTPDGLET